MHWMPIIKYFEVPRCTILGSVPLRSSFQRKETRMIARGCHRATIASDRETKICVLLFGLVEPCPILARLPLPTVLTAPDFDYRSKRFLNELLVRVGAGHGLRLPRKAFLG